LPPRSGRVLDQRPARSVDLQLAIRHPGIVRNGLRAGEGQLPRLGHPPDPTAAPPPREAAPLGSPRMDRAQLSAWIARYEEAWRSPGTESLAGLFARDASYSTAPYENPHEGLDAIAEMWEAERRGPDEEFEMSSEVVAVEDDTGVARVEVRYGPPKE